MKQRRLICLLVAVLLVTVGAVAPVAAAAPQSGTDDEKLIALGIYSAEDSLASQDTLLRRQLAKYAVKLSGVEIGASGTSAAVFSDVNPADEDAAYIAAAYESGYMLGDGSGRFYPDDPVALNEVIKVLLCVLGYEPMAATRGEYPVGYLNTAAGLGLIPYGSSGEDNVTKSQMAAMMVETLETQILSVTQVGNPTRYESFEERTLLWERFGIYKKRGIVDATPYTDLMVNQSDLKDGFVAVDGVAYKDESGKAEEFLGILSQIYVKVVQDEEKILYIEEKPGANEILTLKPDEILEADLSGMEYETETGKQRRMSIASGASFLYNGKQKDVTAEDLTFDTGEITLIDNSGDGRADVVKIISYRTIVVDSVSDSGYLVSDRLGGETIELSPQSTDYDVTITMDGETVDFSSIGVWSVLSYAQSEAVGKQLKTVLVSKNTVSGAVTGKSNSEGEEQIQVEGAWYDAISQVSKNTVVGEQGTFYLDAFGRIAARSAAMDFVYGYLNKMASEGLGQLQMRIFTENARWVTLDVRDSLIYNGTRVSAAQLQAALGETPQQYRQLITYKVDEEACIYEINTARTFEEGSQEEKDAIEQGIFRLSRELTESYRHPLTSFGVAYTFSQQSKFFAVPTEENGDESDFRMITSADLVRDKSYSVKIYDADEMRCAGALVISAEAIEQNDLNSEEMAKILVVTGLSQATNYFDEVVTAVKGYYGGSLVTLALRDESVIEGMDLRVGDVVQLRYDTYGNITQINRLYSSAGGTEQRFVTNGLYAHNTFLAGKVDRIDTQQQRMLLEYDAASVGVFGLNQYLRSIYLYNPKTKTVTVGEMSDITSGDFLFATVRYTQIYDIVIIRGQ